MQTLKEFLLKRKRKKKIKTKPFYGAADPSVFEFLIETLNEYIASDTLVTRLPYTYQSYIKSKWWQIRRDIYKERFCNTCQCCKKVFTKGLQLHHKTYERLRQELVDDLTLVCYRCHFLYELQKLN